MEGDTCRDPSFIQRPSDAVEGSIQCTCFFLHSFLLLISSSHVQGPTVQGDVNLTCDAWQASNTDAYFAVTAHWIKESTDSQWELKSALIGFTKLNNAHNGVRLGQALFKVIKRVGIENKVSEHLLAIALAAHTLNAITPSSPSSSCLPHRHRHHACLIAIAIMPASSPSSSCLLHHHRHRAAIRACIAIVPVLSPPHCHAAHALAVTMKVGHVTCDNASNNTTMMKELAACLKITTLKKYDWKKRKIK